MSKKWSKRVLFAKIESVYGSDSSPGVTDAILTKNLTLDDPYAGERVARDLDLPTLGLEAEINIGPYAAISFDVEIAGSGTAGVAPRYGCLLRACGFTETVVADSGPNYVDYDPNSDLDESATLKFEGDNIQHVLKGARGNVELIWQKGIPYLRFTFSGLYTRPTEVSVGTPDFTGIPVPVPVTKGNTTISLGAFTGPAASLSCNMNMVVYPRNVIGQEEILLTDRGPAGQVVIDQPAFATINLWSAAVESHEAINTLALSLVHGTVAGNKVTFSAPKVQLSTINEGNDNSLANYTLNARYIPDSGDDEVKLRVA